MSEVPGVVTSIDGDHAVVEIGPRAAGCGRCHEPGGCGAPTMGQMGKGGKAGQGMRHYRLPNSVGARIGDDVVLTVPEGSLLKVALMSYLLPIVLVILGAVAGSVLAPDSDALALAGAGIGLALGLAALRLAQSRMLSAREPLLSMRIKDCVFHSHKEISSC